VKTFDPTQHEVLLELKDFSGERFEHVNLCLHSGEVIGLAGVIGAGRTELLESIVSFRSKHSGKVLLQGKEVTIQYPEDAVRIGINLIPEKRTEKGLIESLSVCENVALPSLARFAHTFLDIISHKKEVAAVKDVVRALHIITPSVDSAVKNLSGGNKQKVVFGKWLLAAKDVQGKIFLFDEPTEGVDVGVKAEMWAIIRDLAERGAGIIIASSEMEELMYLSDTLIAMRGGRIVGQVPRAQALHEQLHHWMMADTYQDS
jgi:ribose transport system ATP-binding protein